mmetsp:Transcript_7095/g.15307  ORF Transcript_7095/g.15307 Transcript_7095/m.15307 type:complete len:211 (-) Transcript_7095:85-717(-)|eukprot:CAMPEP_0171356346 /NCGR_PEP_ID=MMETSP0878-20121228/45684_1 /TAXON_ID=67004 /ORGANISM="Thalassiosira weissflogii, Strain CCMP1336" /LENGTH=210 /DNA_ID=CAMNT_0011862367 /DNA_START=14 /DNA_END=646 /DNA_ORIENTATION=+
MDKVDSNIRNIPDIKQETRASKTSSNRSNFEMESTQAEQDDTSDNMHHKPYDNIDSSLNCDLFDTSDEDSIESSIRTMCKPSNKLRKSGGPNNTYGRSRPQCTDGDTDKENKGLERVPQRNFAKRRSKSPLDKPMILSRRMSYKITNPAFSPLSSPITAVKLTFSPHVNTSAKVVKKRPSNQGQVNGTSANGQSDKQGKKVSKSNRRRTT